MMKMVLLVVILSCTLCAAMLEASNIYPDSLALGKYGPRVVVRCTKPINKGDEVCITYIDLLQTRFDSRNLNPPEEAVISSAIEDLDDILQQAISEYSLGDDPQVCCDMIESMLSKNLMVDTQQELPGRRHILHPLHHISLRAYLTLASAYRFRALTLNTDGLKGENSAVSFEMTKAAAVYSFVLAGATHHLFLSECSFMTPLSHFLLSTGQSMLDFVECMKEETTRNVSDAKFSFPSCSSSSAKCDSMEHSKFRSTCEEFGKRILSLSLQCWPFLAQSLPCLENIKTL